MTQRRYIESMEWAGTHACHLAKLTPFEGMATPETFAVLAYRYMRLAGVSPFDNNLNIEVL